MSENSDVCLLVDANNILFKCFFSAPDLFTASGEFVGVELSFLKTIRGYLENLSATSCILVWDGGRSERRLSICEDYKAGRKKYYSDETLKALENFGDQQKVVAEQLSKLSVPSIQLYGKEADDIIYLLSKTISSNTVIVSEDKDLLQCITSKCSVYRPSKEEFIDHRRFSEYAGLPLDHFVLGKAIVGDNSDNIKGVHGVGWKTVEKVLNEIPTDIPVETKIEQLITIASKAKSKRVQKLASGEEVISRNLDMMDMRREPFSPEDVSIIQKQFDSNLFDYDGFLSYLSSKEFRSIISQYHSWTFVFKKLRNIDLGLETYER